ncbi:proline racemase family protein, partial [Bacillus cereus]|nr:proline racemase family protein [Bacillus cereus]
IAVQDGKAIEVSFCNIPAFLLNIITVLVKDIGTIEADIAYGGNFYANIDAKSVELELVTENATTIIDKAIHIRNTIN